jgi:hypothetical protein
MLQPVGCVRGFTVDSEHRGITVELGPIVAQHNRHLTAAAVVGLLIVGLQLYTLRLILAA